MQATPVRPAARRWVDDGFRASAKSDAKVNRPARLPRSATWTDVGFIAFLFALALALRLYLVGHTEVAARDSIGFIRYAWQLDHQPWTEVLRRTEQPPLYALSVLAMSAPVRYFANEPESIVMQRSAQLTSALAGVLLVIPMFLLGKELFDRSVAFWAVVLFQCLPATGRFLSDGLSEATFLLFAAFALWLGVRSLRTRSPLGFALAGLCIGLAYSTRVEGSLIGVALGLVLLGCQVSRGCRLPRKRFLACAASLVAATLVVAGPYMAVIGGITKKESIIRTKESIFGTGTNQNVILAPAGNAGLPLAVWWPGDRDDAKGWWGLWALGTELARGALYLGWLPALIGFVALRDRLRTPGAWLLLVLCALTCAALWRLANVMGYLSDRHCLVILFCATFWMAGGFRAAGKWLSQHVQPYFGEWTSRRGLWRQLVEERLTSGRMLATIFTLALVGAALPKSLETLHGNRAGLRQAGAWLREHADPSDEIVDPYCWAHYYAGCTFREGLPTEPAPGHVPVCYVVLEHGKSEHARLARLDEARERAKKGHVVYRWEGMQGKNAAEVLVYEVKNSTGGNSGNRAISARP